MLVRFNHPNLPIVLTLILGTGLSVMAGLAVARWERANYRLQFQRQTDNLTTTLQRSINRYTDLLLVLGDFYSVSQQPVSRQDFNRFVERVLREYPGIQALEWAPVVPHRDRNAFEAAVQVEGFPAFQITERESRGGLVRARVRSHYIPVTYLQPWQGNALALGYDLASDATRRSALETARDAGQVAASGRIRLVQENKNQFGFLVFLPLYRTATVPPSTASRREQLQGYLLGVFRVSDVVEESLETLGYDIDVTLLDHSANLPDQFLGIYQATNQKVITDPLQEPDRSPVLCPAPADCTYTLTTAGRQWTLTFTPATNYPAQPVWSTLSTLVIGLLLTILVVRYLAQAQSELVRTQELSDLKIRLFSMASHELRTPLSTILLSVQTLETDAADPNQRVYGRIRAAAKRLNQLLNDLLTLARAESGKLSFTPEILDLPEFCQQLIEEVKFSTDHPSNIRLIVGDNCPIAYLDRHLLRAILTNLLSNAVKYSTAAAPVTFTLSCQPHEFRFQVQDSGVGIPERDQDQLYEAFYRGSNVGEISGTGLGLAVVKACLQLHQGTLTCDSQVGQGSTFVVTLPRID
jgi:signal transduction histidine kinase